MRITYTAILSGLIFSVSSALFSARANEHQHDPMTHTASPDASATIYQGSGIVKKWEAQSVTLSHAPIAELNWPAMTMAFALPPHSDTPPLPANTPVTFSFVQHDGGYILTAITPQQR